MKAKKQLSKLSLKELQEKAKKVNGIIIGFSIVWVILIGISIFLFVSLNEGGKAINSISLIVVPILCVTTLLPLLIQKRKLNTEIKARIRQ